MPFIFPDSPTVGDEVSGVNGASWQWDGIKWVGESASIFGGGTVDGPLYLFQNPVLPMEAATKDYVDEVASNSIHQAPFDGQAYGMELGDWTPVLPITGGIMQGSISMDNWWTINDVPMPLLDYQVVPKKYVDEAIAALQTYEGTWAVAANTPNLSNPTLQVNGNYYIATTVNPATPETAPGGIPGIGGQTIYNGSLILWSDATHSWQQVRSGQLTKVMADTLYVALAGSTMSGPLILSGDPTVALGAATKQYVDAGIAAIPRILPMVSISDTAPAAPVIGDLWWNATDNQLYIWYDDGTSQQWVATNNSAGGITEAPTGGLVYGRRGSTASWIAAVPLAGGTMTGFLTLSADPTSNLHAATKHYVDTVAGVTGGPFLPLTGGTLHGDLHFDNNASIYSLYPSSSGHFYISADRHELDLLSNGDNTNASVQIYTVDNLSGGTGPVGIGTGNATNGTSGDLSLWTGNSDTNDAHTGRKSGDLDLTTGIAQGVGNRSGDILIHPGAIIGGAANGNINLYGATSIIIDAPTTKITSTLISFDNGSTAPGSDVSLLGVDVTTGTSAELDFITGNATGAGTTSGSMYLGSGNSASAASGLVSFGSGTGVTTGYAQLFSGDASSSDSGGAFVFSGNSDTGRTGNAWLYSGGTTAGTGVTGDVNIASGDSFGGNSGNIRLTTGAAGVTRGDIILDTGAGAGSNQIWLDTPQISSHAYFWFQTVDGANSGGFGGMSGAGIGGTSGDAWFGTGDTDGANSGMCGFGTGNVTGSGTSGHVDLATGNSTAGASGNINIYLGIAPTQGDIILHNYKTADPHVAGAIWCDTSAGRVLKVSAG